MRTAKDKLGEVVVVAIDVESGKIYKVKGIKRQNIDKINAALDKLGFDAKVEKNFKRLTQQLSGPTDKAGFMLHTHSSPGCQWIFQDGWWRYVCNRRQK